MLSYTQITTYLRCPLWYKLKYIDHIPEKKSKHLIFGSALHESLNYVHDTKDVRRAPEIFANIFDDLLNEPESEQLEDKEKQEFVLLGHNLLTQYLPIFTKLDIKAEEQQVIFTVDGIELLGYLDYILKDGTILDIKTSKRKWNKQDVANSLQMMLYSMAYREFMNRKEKSIRIDVLIKTKKPNVQSLSLPPFDQGMLDHARRIVYGVAEAIDKHLFYPCDPSSWQCRGCPYREICFGTKK